MSSATATEAGPAGQRVTNGRVKRLAMLASCVPDQADGVRDYTMRLIAEIGKHRGWIVDLHLRYPFGESAHAGWDAAPTAGQLSDADVVLVQYSPFWYGRGGFAPELARELWRLKRPSRGPGLALMLHETFVDGKGLRLTAAGAWQRAQLLALQAAADVQLVSTEAWLRRARSKWPAPSGHHLPVASNFPDARAERDLGRRELGLGDDALVLSCFGMHHAGRSPTAVMAAARECSSRGFEVHVLNLGTGEQGVRRMNGFTIHSPGYLDPRSAARLVAASDMFLAPYADGVSTRRTTVMSALQQGVAVVGTHGKFTDRVFRRAADTITLAPVDRPELFAAAAAALASDGETRRVKAQAGRDLYQRRFDWPVLTTRLLGILEPLAHP